MNSGWDIWSEIENMQQEFNTLFERFFGSETNTQKSRRLLPGKTAETALSEYREPLTDVWETDNDVVATIELPGVSKEDINLNVTDNRVEVKVEKKEEKKEKKKGLYRLERSYRGFYRAFPLPSEVKADEAKATYKNGVLEITIPKKQPSQGKQKRVPIE